uniref:Uncharacterized protein n=1 Tax=Schistocephalus solidus TaxID=70667 RepID=A0A0V0JCK3_SCHSO
MCTRRQLISFGPGRVQSVFGLQVVQCFAFLVHVNLLELLVLLVVEDNKISIADVETAKMITGIFCVKDVLIHNQSSTLCFRCVSDPDLSNGTVLAKYVIHLLRRDVVRQIFHKEDPVHFWRKSCICTFPQGHDSYV